MISIKNNTKVKTTKRNFVEVSVENPIEEYLKQEELKKTFFKNLINPKREVEFMSEKKFMSWFKNYCEQT